MGFTRRLRLMVRPFWKGRIFLLVASPKARGTCCLTCPVLGPATGQAASAQATGQCPSTSTCTLETMLIPCEGRNLFNVSGQLVKLRSVQFQSCVSTCAVTVKRSWLPVLPVEAFSPTEPNFWTMSGSKTLESCNILAKHVAKPFLWKGS